MAVGRGNLELGLWARGADGTLRGFARVPRLDQQGVVYQMILKVGIVILDRLKELLEVPR